MRKELQLLEHWLRLLACHADISGMSFDEIHALCRGLSDDLDILESRATDALLTVQAQHERITALETAADHDARAEDIRNRLSAGH